MKQSPKLLKKIIVWMTMFTLLIGYAYTGPGFLPIRNAEAGAQISPSVSGLLTENYQYPIKQGSDRQAILRFDIYNADASVQYLSSTTLYFYGNNFNGPSTLSPTAADDTSGVAVYRDHTSGNTGKFVYGEDTVLSLNAIPLWTGGQIPLDFLSNNSLPALATTTFFVVIKTNMSAVNGMEIKASIPYYNIWTTSGYGPSSTYSAPNSFIVDTLAPQINDVEYINQNSVKVVFSEKIRANLLITSDFKINGSTANVSSVNYSSVEDRAITLSSNIAITPLASTVSISGVGLIQDLAGNTNTTNGPATVQNPKPKIRISEFSADYKDYAGSDTEFIELYNTSASSIDIGNYIIQYSPATTTAFTTIATVPAFTFIPAYSYYLIGGPSLNNVSPVSKDLNFDGAYYVNNLFPADGGHIRIVSGSTEIDRLGWGSAIAPEGTAAPAFTSSTSLERKAFGTSLSSTMAPGGTDVLNGNSWDTDNNYQDFVVQTETNTNPQNLFESETPDSTGNINIKHAPIHFAETGSDLAVLAQFGDSILPPEEIKTALYYRTNDGNKLDDTYAQYLTSSTTGSYLGNGYYKFIIPAATISASTANGLNYFLEAKADERIRYMSYSPAADNAGDINEIVHYPFTIFCDSPGASVAVSGTISLSDYADPSKVLVYADGTGRYAYTDSSGNWSLSLPPYKTYSILMSKSGYQEAYYSYLYINAATPLGTRTLYAGTSGGTSGDSTKPSVKWTGPTNGSTGMPTNYAFNIKIGLSKDISSSTFNTDNVFITTDGNTPLNNGYTVTYYDPLSSRSTDLPSVSAEPYLGVVSIPAGILANGTTYQVIITPDVQDFSGNSISGNTPNGNYAFSFTTQGSISGYTYGSGANNPPYVVDIKPAPGMTVVPKNSKIIATFSEAMDYTSTYCNNLSTCNIKLYKVSTSGTEYVQPISAELDTSGKFVIITPSSIMYPNYKYRIKISGAVKSTSQICMDYSCSSSVYVYKSEFETSAISDTSFPYVVGSWPSDGETAISVNPGAFNIQFNKNLNPATVNNNTVTLKQGTTQITSEIKYDSGANAVYIMPYSALTAGANYMITLTGSSTGIADLGGNPLSSDYYINFTTDTAYDASAPEILYANADEYTLAVTFSEPMNSAMSSDTYNWSKSVLNPANYVVKWGDPATVSTSGTILNLASLGTQFSYDPLTNTVKMQYFGLSTTTTANKDFYVDMSGGQASDLSLNLISAGTADTIQTAIKDSAVTKGELAPNTTGTASYDIGTMGMMKAGAFPKNHLAGQTTTYFIDIPTYREIPAGGKITITFPYGFDVTNANVSASSSPINKDINGGNPGTIGISSVVNASARYVTITLSAATQAADYLHIDLNGIVNSLIQRSYDTAGYSVDIKTFSDIGAQLESIASMPFFISPAGSYSLDVQTSGIDAADVDGTGDTVKVYLGSPTTGPLEKLISVLDNGSGQTTFSNLPAGQYHIYTDAAVMLDGSRYSGSYSPNSITLNASASTTVAFAKDAAGAGKKAVNVYYSGTFGTDNIDIYASNPGNFRKITVENPGTLAATSTFYLPDGAWYIGLMPAKADTPTAGTAEMPDWMPPMPIMVTVSGGGVNAAETSGTANDGNISFVVNSANKQIVGYVRDNSGSAIANADVWAYQPGGANTGAGAYTASDATGRFVLKMAQTGTYKVGAYKSGLPLPLEKSISVKANTINTDGNTTADIYNETGTSTLATEANPIVFKIKRPTYTIYGKVSGNATGTSTPAAFVPVWANQSSGYGHAETVTDSSGNYILYVDNGTWNIQSYISGLGNTETKTVIVNGADVSQNLAPNSSLSYKTITGLVGLDSDDIYSTVETPFAYMPIRAVAYNASGVYQGKEYNTVTDSAGNYSLTVPAGIYRVDTWTSQYGEQGINNQDNDDTLNEAEDDDYANNPANVNASSDVTNANIIIPQTGLKNISLAFNNAVSGQEGFLKIEGITAATPPSPTGFSQSIRISDLSAGADIRLASGRYRFNISVPGLGNYIPDEASSTKYIDISTDASLSFTLSVQATDTEYVSGTVTDGTDPLSDAWVWVNNPTTGYNYGVQTNGYGVYSMNIPNGSGYIFGATKPSYLASSTDDYSAIATTTTIDFAISAASRSISGVIYADADSDSQYDSGEEISGGFVRAVTTDGAKTAFGPVDSTGRYVIGVVNGVWKIYGTADGYTETQYGDYIDISDAILNAVNKNIKMTVDANWTNRNKTAPITPSAGGTIDDTSSGGTGIRLFFPPNALGSSNDAGNVNVNSTAAVATTNSSEPVGNEGVSVNATNNSGQSINNLNDYIDLEMVLTKADVAAEISSGNLSYAQLKNTVISYWDASLGDWVSLSTTRQAYYKADVSDAEWSLYSNTSTTTDEFSAFINEIASGSLNPYDYKLSFTAKSNHLTVFAVIMPYIAAPAQASPSTPSSPGGGSSGSLPTSYCTSVTYDQWGGCISGYQYRNILTRTPNNCTLTTAQENDRKQACELAAADATETTTQTSSQTSTELYLSEAEMIERAEVSEMMAATSIAVRNHTGEKLSRDTLTNKLKINLSGLPLKQQYALANFITYGSPATTWLGWSERAGVINSFKAAFGTLPLTAADWQDIVKIGNGRWTKQKSSTAETNAAKIFKKIYKRDANLLNKYDSNALSVIAYGLRPAKRNYNSEKAAILIFKGIYKYNPFGATDWDIMRAIAYSGAKR